MVNCTANIEKINKNNEGIVSARQISGSSPLPLPTHAPSMLLAMVQMVRALLDLRINPKNTF